MTSPFPLVPLSGPDYDGWWATVGRFAGVPYAPPQLYGGDVPAFGGTPAIYGAAPLYGAAGGLKQHKIDLVAPQAKEIRVWQVNHGGKRHIKNILPGAGGKGKFKTWKRVKAKRADNPALVQFHVFWKKDAGGGDSWTVPVKFGTSKTWELKRPENLPAGSKAGTKAPTGGGDAGDASSNWTQPVGDVATTLLDAGQGWLQGGGAGAGTVAPAQEGGMPGWVLPVAGGAAVGIPLLVFAVKKMGSKKATVAPAAAVAAGQGARWRRR